MVLLVILECNSVLSKSIFPHLQLAPSGFKYEKKNQYQCPHSKLFPGFRLTGSFGIVIPSEFASLF